MEMLFDHLLELGVIQKEQDHAVGYSKSFTQATLGILRNDRPFLGTIRLLGDED
jgi:hypothetical protein